MRPTSTNVGWGAGSRRRSRVCAVSGYLPQGSHAFPEEGAALDGETQETPAYPEVNVAVSNMHRHREPLGKM